MNVSPIIFAALATVLLSGCYATVPPIAQGGPRDDASVTPYFDNQVKQRFPVGSDEKQLRAELHRESFKIRETNDPNLGYKYVATFEDSGICKNTLDCSMEYGPGKNHEYHSDVFPDLPLDSECLMWHFCPSQPYGPIIREAA